MAKKKSSPKIIGLLQEHLRKQLGDTAIVFKELNASEIFGIVGGQGTVFMYDEESGYKVSIIPILRKNSDYWCSLILSLKGVTSEVDNISISIYAGNKSDQEKTKLFRAEWSTNSHHQHAQPHWHLHTDSAKEKKEVWSEDIQPVNFYNESFTEGSKLKKIHFAMAARWHEKRESHIVSLRGVNETSVLQWIGSTLDYILHQLNYLENKSELQD